MLMSLRAFSAKQSVSLRAKGFKLSCINYKPHVPHLRWHTIQHCLRTCGWWGHHSRQAKKKTILVILKETRLKF